ncbi:hypothetical protein BJ166DRAFT_510501 [Pestalotiopsis sp. NC0098]|nr:hypothetical protein BJ166DRAFT_510501 [Pestalotiopsis sp. NC0098]
MQEHDDDDKDRTLSELARHHGKSIVDLLLETQQHSERRGKDLGFIRNLECFFPRSNLKRKRASLESFSQGAEPSAEDSADDGSPAEELLEDDGFEPHTSILRSDPVDAYEEPDYVAVSWCWTLPGDNGVGELSDRYEMETRDGSRVRPRLRDRVFDRVLKYMHCFDVGLFWIDRYSIPQRVCQRSHQCDHIRCFRKRESLHAMDLVYKYSNYPLGLLEQELKDEDDLHLLALLLGGIMVEHALRPRKRFWLSKGADMEDAKKALALVHRLIRDPWWKRAWIYQENYRGGAGMTLLLSHSRHLERPKRELGFGKVLGELCINSAELSYQASRLCLALQSSKHIGPDERNMITTVLAAAGRYKLLLEGSSSMAPSIISSIEQKDIGSVWDRIAITANCCKYPVRIKDATLRRRRHSLSLSILTMYLLNGEVLNNSLFAGEATAGDCTVSQYIHSQSFKGFRSPGDKHSLAFNRGCRFTHVQLTRDGIHTKGHLWRLGPIIKTSFFSDDFEGISDAEGVISLYERKRLLQLARELRALSHIHLAEQLEKFLEQDAAESLKEEPCGKLSFSQEYMRRMASELVNAIDDGEPLRLGQTGSSGEYSAIFTCATENDLHGDLTAHREEVSAAGSIPDSWVFTATWPRETGRGIYDDDDVDHHLSLEVQLASKSGDRDCPRLYTKQWRSGLCFFRGWRRQDVIFPWPRSLSDIL